MEFRGKEHRAQCYLARDGYFDCIDSKDNKETCQDLLLKFEQTCGKKWTEHFIRKRDYNKFKERLYQQGVESVDEQKLV